MSIERIRINYSGSCDTLFRRLFVPLQTLLSQELYTSWSVSRSWQRGPHANVDLDTRSPFYCRRLLDTACNIAQTFLDRQPGPDYDRERYCRVQERLRRIDGAGVESEGGLAQNNTIEVESLDIASCAARYETEAQWLTVFEAEVQLRAFAIREWRAASIHSEFLKKMLTMLACIYPPSPSDAEHVNEYNGFLSFNANFRFWHHHLPVDQKQSITARFETLYERESVANGSWLARLAKELTMPSSRARRSGDFLLSRFNDYARLATEGVIHERSPYARDALRPVADLPVFHQQLFYDGEGRSISLGPVFAAYRWLLNIVYKNLPLFDVSPLQRQYFNYALDRMQRAHPALIREVRHALLVYA